MGITTNRLIPKVGWSLITEQAKLSIKHGRVLFYTIVINQKKDAHILISVRVVSNRKVSKTQVHAVKAILLENSYLHEYWIKLDDSKTTMMLQKMEQLLVPLGTSGSKHKLS